MLRAPPLDPDQEMMSGLTSAELHFWPPRSPGSGPCFSLSPLKHFLESYLRGEEKRGHTKAIAHFIAKRLSNDEERDWFLQRPAVRFHHLRWWLTMQCAASSLSKGTSNKAWWKRSSLAVGRFEGSTSRHFWMNSWERGGEK